MACSMKDTICEQRSLLVLKPRWSEFRDLGMCLNHLQNHFMAVETFLTLHQMSSQSWMIGHKTHKSRDLAYHPPQSKKAENRYVLFLSKSVLLIRYHRHWNTDLFVYSNISEGLLPPIMALSSSTIMTSTYAKFDTRAMKLITRADPFHALVESLSTALGPSSGLDSADVDPMYLVSLMSVYTSNEKHWLKYALADPNRNYTRNLVDRGNGKSNLLVIVWNPGKSSPIHDHADAHCVMKVLKGSLKETLYSVPREDGALKTVKETVYTENQVTYISDQIGLHKIENASTREPAISLHLYTPPHAANFGFNLFDESTGKCSHVKQAGVFSDRGQLVQEIVQEVDQQMAKSAL